MNIALVVTNLQGGGAEKAMITLAATLRANGHEVCLILLEDIRQHGVPEGLPILALTPPGKPLSKGWLGKWLAAWRLRRVWSRQHPFDLVISTLPFADEVCRKARLPHHWMRIANTLSSEINALRQKDPVKAARRLARYRGLYADQSLIAVSNGAGEDLSVNLAIQPRQLRVIHNLFDFERMRQLAKMPVEGVPESPYVIHVGRFARQKRHDLLLDAWQILETPHQLVLLTEPCSKLEQWIVERGLKNRVRIVGFQPNPYPWIARAELLVLCSDHEGMPNVLIESLACGTPVVSTDCPSGPRELLLSAIPEALVPMNDAKALADRIHRLLTHSYDPSRVDLSAFTPAVTIAALESLEKP
ncbi:MAG: glycosyltransferase [Magnetococcales bacterium]|nr:glycosyltransferase [Magnetococcales bacterium]MBF0438214.1 glycosyltransferase [Magnetococcales bacterium]